MEFVTFQIAKKLKEKGYPQVKQSTLAMYNEDGEWYSMAEPIGEAYIYEDFDDRDCVCPTISQVLKWLREEKEIDIVIYPIDACTAFIGGEKYILSVYISRKRDYKLHHDNKDKYVKWEQAAIAGIEYTIEKLVKEPKRVLRTFSVYGTEIKAYSKKDALKKYNHLIKNK